MHNKSLDIIHRAYKEYTSLIASDPASEKFYRTIVGADNDTEHCDSALCTCIVLTDWIERIERALPYIERAVKENRQFILRQ